jgi:hypothetical protein
MNRYDTEPNDLAFPSSEGQSDGLTKIEFFAAMALQGLLANSQSSRKPGEMALKAIECANHLIGYLNKNGR